MGIPSDCSRSTLDELILLAEEMRMILHATVFSLFFKLSLSLSKATKNKLESIYRNKHFISATCFAFQNYRNKTQCYSTLGRYSRLKYFLNGVANIQKDIYNRQIENGLLNYMFISEIFKIHKQNVRQVYLIANENSQLQNNIIKFRMARRPTDFSVLHNSLIDIRHFHFKVKVFAAILFFLGSGGTAIWILISDKFLWKMISPITVTFVVGLIIVIVTILLEKLNKNSIEKIKMCPEY
ncbi:MAG: hypothetical protein LBJ93_04275 [Clostridiales bacterium]|nr:hypothetical protein [Clostridiales bacterium]